MLAGKWSFRRRDRLTRLAEAIESAAERDRERILESERVDTLRARGAAELHASCRELVDALNARLSSPAVILDPPVYLPGSFDVDGPNLFQINLRGRLLQIEFAAPAELISTEDFRTPYVLNGAVRTFNQDYLDRGAVDEQNIYYCLDGGGGRWFFSDSRAYRNGRLTSDFLAAELERIL